MSATGEDYSEANIVDCDVLEAAKENVQRLATGRRVTALSAILSTPHAQREAKLSATRNRLRINVELALDDEEEGDPLEAYCRLVYWTVENYPQGQSAESGLVELLEEATRTLKDDRGGKWRGDLKYLKLWLLYASYVDRPTLIYKFLIANDIGTEFALLYEEHAAVLERDGRRKEADEAYALGIARRATPLEHLQSRYQDFQKRMMTNQYLPAAQPVASTSQKPRKALATTASSVPASSSRQPLPRTTPAATPGIPPSSSNSRIQIFVDPTGSEAQAAEHATNEWNDLGTRKSRISENVPEVKKLAGSTLKQAGRSKRIAASSGAGGAASGSGSKIVPFRDPEPGDMPPPPVPKKKDQPGPAKAPAARGFVPFVDEEDGSAAVAQAPAPAAAPAPSPSFTPFRDESAAAGPAAIVPIADSIMKIKKNDLKAPAPTTEAEALRKDPLKNYDLESLGKLNLDSD
ncbi:Mitotic spindle checkpoint component mad3 [Psilocybe cubensis]|uniref:Mitotic spindle checkpoint component mad3 n=2 Tax=Psilocybe cubensis TaxID=181762 RepID=A0ACB8GSV8_PSICU|nr:Mitotic spindle checkpoint component mad3 [Psilocybe cubensis]KAH9478316.1 Mitotic spindle checkpoint component mad3 [Psilocybe cubensis]